MAMNSDTSRDSNRAQLDGGPYRFPTLAITISVVIAALIGSHAGVIPESDLWYIPLAAYVVLAMFEVPGIIAVEAVRWAKGGVDE